jgi:glycosyltransferase involved in cell wall biosynthesis
MQSSDKTPKVSVLMTTYNHAPYITQAIESVVRQQTTFTFELVIGEDCSTDQTRAVVLELQQQYPAIIRTLLPEKNLGPHANYIQSYQACRGEYLALLEGDDYWTSDEKLQKQVDFLENHLDFAFCFHWAELFDQESGTLSDWKYGPPILKSFYTIDDLLEFSNFIPTCSVMTRNKLFGEFPKWYWKSRIGDFPQHILNAQYGNIGFLDEFMAVYRAHYGGLYSSQTNIRKLQDLIHIYHIIGTNLGLQTRLSYRRRVAQFYRELSTALREERHRFQAFQAAYQGFYVAPASMKRDMCIHGALILLPYRHWTQPLREKLTALL